MFNILEIFLGEMTSQVLKIATEARKCTLGPFSPYFNINQILADGLHEILPEDVHIKVRLVKIHQDDISIVSCLS